MSSVRTHRPTHAGRGRRVLVVEDDRAIADAVGRRLAAEGYEVQVVHDGLAAVESARHTRYDAVVLDVMLPGLSGLEVCRQIQVQAPVPVIMVTARDEEADRLIGLAVGADDYLTKPFSPRELVARVAALIRRVDRARELAAAAPSSDEAAPIRVGDLEIDEAARLVRLAGETVHLTRTELDLVATLARRPGSVITREALLEQVWGWSAVGAVQAARSGPGRTLDSHVRSVRRKLGAERIRTSIGVGYALETLTAAAE